MSEFNTYTWYLLTQAANKHLCLVDGQVAWSSCLVKLANHCSAAQKKTQFHQKKECCAGALEGSFLKSLVRLTGAKTVLEVGMFTGTSSLAMAEALPSDGKVIVYAML